MPGHTKAEKLKRRLEEMKKRGGVGRRALAGFEMPPEMRKKTKAKAKKKKRKS